MHARIRVCAWGHVHACAHGCALGAHACTHGHLVQMHSLGAHACTHGRARGCTHACTPNTQYQGNMSVSRSMPVGHKCLFPAAAAATAAAAAAGGAYPAPPLGLTNPVTLCHSCPPSRLLPTDLLIARPPPCHPPISSLSRASPSPPRCCPPPPRSCPASAASLAASAAQPCAPSPPKLQAGKHTGRQGR